MDTEKFDLEAVTLDDCIRKFMLEQKETVIKAGHVKGFSYSGKECKCGYKK